MADNNTNANEAQELSELLQIRRDKLSALQEQGKDPFVITLGNQNIHSNEIAERFEELEGKDVCIAGRIMSRRIMGKASFASIQDRNGRMQVYVRRDDVGEEVYMDFKKLWDIGDICEVTGFVFKTQTGEITVHAREIRLLSKSLLPLPEKFHGLKDTDTRYRQRYVDLIVNPEVKDTFEKRAIIIKTIRDVLDDMNFVEVETPVLNVIPGGAAARPFITYHNTLEMEMYLRIATELYLKRLIVGGMERVYEIGRIFRNEGMDIRHNPEFTSIELYQAYTDYHGMMDITEKLIYECVLKVCKDTKVIYQGTEIDFSAPFKRLSMLEAVNQFAGVDFDSFKGDDNAARDAVKAMGAELKGTESWGDCLVVAFEEKVEDKLIQPTFIYDYPVENSPLTKRKPSRPELTERFELFVYGRELANAYSELNDPIDQRERFVRQAELRAAGDEEANMLDDDFLTALEYGMPPTGGMGMGIDRLVMFLTDSASIRDVLLFPTMKPLEK
ncbi:MAG: lysine--tRNA ligase [Clostridia bacterium]|nr:lysine--tRNA ligase [Clostridia bacterium]